jgi:predicted Zn-dependent peptidase
MTYLCHKQAENGSFEQLLQKSKFDYLRISEAYQKTIAENYDKIGAYFNANTNKQYTVYVVKCNNDYVENSIAILSDMMMNSTFEYSINNTLLIIVLS